MNTTTVYIPRNWFAELLLRMFKASFMEYEITTSRGLL